MSIDIPVFLVDVTGIRGIDNVNCSPCIDLTIVGPGLARKVVALLDSGATGIYGDPPIMDLLQLPIIKQDTVFAVGAAHTTNVHTATFWIDDLPDLQVQIQAVPCRSAGKPYDIVLGRSFLTMFDFGFDQRTRAWRLVSLGQAKADNSNRLLRPGW